MGFSDVDAMGTIVIPVPDLEIIDETVLDDSIPCGFDHKVAPLIISGAPRVCSVEVVALNRSKCGNHCFYCKNAAEFVATILMGPFVKCRDCGNFVCDDWWMTPV